MDTVDGVHDNEILWEMVPRGSLLEQGDPPQASGSHFYFIGTELHNTLYFTLCLAFLESHSQILSSGKNTETHDVYSM